jgi:hypothetical protein
MEKIFAMEDSRVIIMAKRRRYSPCFIVKYGYPRARYFCMAENITQ